VTLAYFVTPYTGDTCVEIAGHGLSKGVIAVIVIGAVLVLVVIGVLIKCCCFCL